MKTKPFVLLFFLLVITGFRSQAQLGEYTFSQSTTAPYVPLTTANIPLVTTGGSTGYYNRVYYVPLPFTFTLGNISSDSLWVDLAGFCALHRVGPLPSGYYGTDLALSNMPYYTGVIAPQAGMFMTTLANPSNSGIRTDVSGTAPNRVFTVEWVNLRYPGRSVEARLHETSNIIDFCYSIAGTTDQTTEVGLRLADTTVFTGQTIGRSNRLITDPYALLHYSRWDTTRAMDSIGDKMTLTSFEGAYIPTMLQYTWTPPAACASATTAGQLPDSLHVCSGAAVLLKPSGLASGLAYQWQTSADGLNWTNVTDGTGAQNFQYHIEGLRDTAARWFRLQGTCAASQQVLYSNPVAIHASQLLPPYFEGFEGIAANQLPSCMNTPPRSSGFAWNTYISASDAYDGSGVMAQSSSSGILLDEWLYTPGVYLEAGKQYRFSYLYRLPFSIYPVDSLETGVGSLPTSDSITSIRHVALNPLPYYNPVQPPMTNRQKYRRMETTFSVPTSGIYFGGIRRATSGSYVLYVDNIELTELPATDVKVDSVLSPSVYTTTCYQPQMNVVIKVSNAGTQPVSNIPVYYKLGNTTYGPELISQTIPAGSSIQYTFSQQASMPNLYTTYYIQAWSGLSTDSYHRNDTSYVMGFQTDTLKPVPYVQAFEYPGSNTSMPLSYFKWYGNSTVSAVSSTSGSSDILRINFGNVPANGKDSIATMPIGPMAGNSFLRFKYRMANQTGATATMSTADTIYVLGTVCGQDADTLLTIHAGWQTTSSSLQYAPTVPLGQYAGNPVRISFVTRKASQISNFYFDIDSFQVLSLKPVDMALAGVGTVPSVVCTGDNASAQLIVKNLGALTASGFPVNALVDGQPLALNYTYPGSLGYNQTDTIVVGPVSFATPGLHTLKLLVQQPQDTTTANDTLYRTVLTVVPPAAPASLDTSICHSMDLQSGNADSTLAFWYYDNQPGAQPFHIGNTLANVNSSDTFYVANRKWAGITAGPQQYNPNGSSPALYSGAGLRFDAHSDFVLDSVGVYPSGTGSISFDLVSCASCNQPNVLGTYNFSFTNASGNTRQMLPVQQYIPAGRDYAIRLQSYNGLNGLVRDFPFTGFPLDSADWPVAITSSFINGSAYDSYYYFYDWKIKALSSCSSAEATQAVRIGTPPSAAFTASVTDNTVTCTNLSQGGGAYNWTFGDGTGSPLAAPTHTYTASGTYTVKLVQTNECGMDSVTKEITVTAAGIATTGAALPGFKVYPNPASDKVFVAFTAQQKEIAVLSLRNTFGQILHTATYHIVLGSTLLEQDVAGLPAGTYWLTLSLPDGRQVVKVTVLH